MILTIKTFDLLCVIFDFHWKGLKTNICLFSAYWMMTSLKSQLLKKLSLKHFNFFDFILTEHGIKTGWRSYARQLFSLWTIAQNHCALLLLLKILVAKRQYNQIIRLNVENRRSFGMVYCTFVVLFWSTYIHDQLRGQQLRGQIFASFLQLMT